jgi:hypothetical protein
MAYVHTNDFDEKFITWVDYWDDWNYPEGSEPYTFKMNGGEIEDKLTYDLAKAVCFKESHMDEVDLMQMTPVALQSLSGIKPKNDWNWSVLPDADGDYPVSGIVELNYTGVTDTSEEASLKWGIRWLYAEKSRALNGSKPGTYQPVWDNWTTTLENYNGESTKVQYAIDVMTLYRSGRNPHDGNPTYMWPIMTNGNARQ